MIRLFLTQLFPMSMDFAAHVVIAGLFVFWWVSRCAGESDESIRAEALPLRYSSRPGQPEGRGGDRRREGRRWPLHLAGLLVVGALGAGIAVATAYVAVHTPRASAALPEEEMDH